MKGLPTLIRLRKWELDEKRRHLAELRQLESKLDDALARLEQDVVDEQRFAGGAPEVAHAYAPFAAAALERRRTLEASLGEVREQVEAALEALRIAFQELKKFEVAQNHRTERSRTQTRRREQITLDDIAIETFRRS